MMIIQVVVEIRDEKELVVVLMMQGRFFWIGPRDEWKF
jgi:hypothetical protein